MSHSLSSWINHIKSDDIDGGLAADFDGSLSGLGSELGSNPYNMSEALLALPPVAFKQENSKTRPETKTSDSTSFAGFLTSGRSLTLPGRNSPIATTVSYQTVDLPISGTHSLSLPNLQQHCGLGENGFESSSVVADTINSEWVSLMTSMNLGEVGDVEDSGESRFQYILNAATSPATRMSEETLTYLNQGQSYEVRLRRLREGLDPDEHYLKSIVRVVFHERRLQYMEKEQLDVWKLTRPGERIVDIDIPLCKGLVDVKIDPHRLNCVEFVWDPQQTETKVAIKIHCISTEFTAKKHGGEKGVPFRIQVETYMYYTTPAETDVPLLLHCASCQVKVFKPKGADRKHKTDRDKIERRSASEKEKYQPSYECTVLTEIPLDQVHKYLELLNRQKEEDDRLGKDSTSLSFPSDSSVAATSTVLPSASPPARVVKNDMPNAFLHVINEVVGTAAEPEEILCNGNVSLPTPTARPVTPSIASLSRKRPSETALSICSSTASMASVSTVELSNKSKDSLSVSASAEEVASWLNRNRFSPFLSSFQNFTGADLLCLCRNDLIDICGTADGIRLYNALQSRTVRPKLTIYLCQQPTSSDIIPGFSTWRDGGQVSTVKFRSRSSTPSPTSEGDVIFIEPAKTATTDQKATSASTPEVVPQPVIVDSKCDSGLTLSAQTSGSKREIGSQTCLAAKRQMREHDDEDDENVLSFTANKKQRMQGLELTQREVFHAVYLDSLSEYHLREKISGLFNVLPTQILEMFLQGPLGIHILVTDLVVQNFRDQSSFIVCAVQDDDHSGLYRVVLKYVDNTT